MKKAQVTVKAKQIKDSVTCAPGVIRLSELKMLAQNSKSSKTSVNLSDHIITQREKEEEEEEAAKYNCDPEPLEMAATDQQQTALSETRHRRRKAAAKADTAVPVVKETAEDKCRGRRQKDFDTAEQEEGSDDESRKRERCHSSEDLWTQNQQKLLELALQQYPKGTAERWDKIAKYVPGKSKEECVARYKLLVELIQKKKMAKS
ncbi:UNVERIFIED_CONTAM: hypothetical protein K2H54_027369 [Gekko kuhli]